MPEFNCHLFSRIFEKKIDKIKFFTVESCPFPVISSVKHLAHQPKVASTLEYTPFFLQWSIPACIVDGLCAKHSWVAVYTENFHG